MGSDPKYLTGDAAAIGRFIDKFDVFLFDCDGVLWSGDHAFPKTVETLELLRSKGKKTVFVTNNSTKSRSDYQKKLSNMHLPSTIDDIFSSSYSAAIYISLILRPPANKNKVFVLGESGIETELAAVGLPYTGGTDPDFQKPMTSEDYTAIASGKALDPSVGIVLSGLDFHLSYRKISLAYHYIVKNGATFLATNADTTFPSAGSLFPGAGACTAALVAMLGGQKPTALGKPDPAMMKAVEGKFQFDRSRACMIGDRLDTDIAFGIDGGLGGTLCVLTGVTKGKEDWEKEGSKVKPAYWVDKLGDLLG